MLSNGPHYRTGKWYSRHNPRKPRCVTAIRLDWYDKEDVKVTRFGPLKTVRGGGHSSHYYRLTMSSRLRVLRLLNQLTMRDLAR